MKKRYSLKLIMESYLNEYTDDKDAKVDVSSSEKQSNKQKGGKSASKSVSDLKTKKQDSRRTTEMLDINGELESGLAYSYENADHLADSESLPAVDLKRLMADDTGFYDKDFHIESLFLQKGDTRGTWLTTSPYADMDKDTPREKKAKNTKFAFSVTTKNKMEKFNNILDWYAALQKGGITKEEIQKANEEIQSKNVAHEDELEREVKKLNENYGLSRGSLYRRRYTRY